ncbi:uncharacterized protein LOC108087841 [Drosophila ficusphila]|uniref:uncharacterized protein LOC108087841 n=1 Tax=Drosophila ficusphila TaxID=30025 RepID=UPI0007E89465|nr:uncharacterized protein LOC108087841 [Drosophila ficusphila]
MVRRRILTNSAKQTSMNAYQQWWQQQQYARNPMVASMPEYWHSVCNKMGGAMPRMALLVPPEVSSRKLTRLRRQLMRPPRETIPIQSFIPNYGLQLNPQMQIPRGYEVQGKASCLNQGLSKASLLKPGCLMSAYQNQCFRNPPTGAGVATSSQQQHYNQENSFGYPDLHWQQQQYQVQQQHKQFLMQQQQRAVPSGILKNSSRTASNQRVMGDFQSYTPFKRKKVSIKSTTSRYQQPKVEQLKTKPVIPTKPSKKIKQNVLKKEREQLQQLQIEHELLKQRQNLQSEKEKAKVQHQKYVQQQHLLQHQQDLRKLQQHRKSLLQLDKSSSFNFGKLANHLIEGCRRDSDTETSMFTAANDQIKSEKQSFRPQNVKKVQSSRTKSFASEETRPEKLQANQEKPEVSSRVGKVSSRRFLDRQTKRLGSGNESSTITLTTENLSRSHTSLTDKATNTKADSLNGFLKSAPRKSLSTTSATSKGSKKMNINELLRNEKVRGLDGNPMWASLMQLVAHMCEAKENEKADENQKSRLRAGSGTDKQRKQYSVYLMVTSDEEEDEKNSSKTKVETSSSDPNLASNSGFNGGDDYTNKCFDLYQEEHQKLGRHKRKRTRLSSRLDQLSIPYPSTQTQVPMRRPLHWPKPDFSKSQSRSNRVRNPSRVRARSVVKKVVKFKSQKSSTSSTLDEKRSWRLWKDLPMTAKVLNKAYSRMLTLSGGNPNSSEI